MKVNFLQKSVLVAVLAGSAIATAVEPAKACSFKVNLSEMPKSLPMWVGAIAMGAIAGSVVANEIGKSDASRSL